MGKVIPKKENYITEKRKPKRIPEGVKNETRLFFTYIMKQSRASRQKSTIKDRTTVQMKHYTFNMYRKIKEVTYRLRKLRSGTCKTDIIWLSVWISKVEKLHWRTQ